VDHFVAISSAVRDRIAAFYGRSSTVIHPPTRLARYEVAGNVDEACLVLARLVPYKRIDLAVQAFTHLGRRLVVVGDGRDRARLEGMAGPTIEFRGRLPDDEVVGLLSRCRALVWPGVEDYGLAPVEAMASGRPVIARRAGGVLDTVVEGVTGVFFDAPDPGALARAVERADEIDWQPAVIRDHARSFGHDVFEARLSSFLRSALVEGKRKT
jgi:glycosyltransferase involved in cell wall biosynthesis